jgi:ferric-dicitrate binding protein FerR (iron transport regulator)
MAVTPRVRVGDRERESAAERLSAHAAAGRLSVAELEERVERAQAAVYADDLRALEADLPAPAPTPARRRPPRVPAAAAALACLLAAVLLTALIGHPVVPLFIVAALLLRRAAYVTRAGVASTLR